MYVSIAEGSSRETDPVAPRNPYSASKAGGDLLALAYVLVLAIVALEVPLALSLRERVDAEVRSQARVWL